MQRTAAMDLRRSLHSSCGRQHAARRPRPDSSAQRSCTARCSCFNASQQRPSAQPSGSQASMQQSDAPSRRQALATAAMLASALLPLHARAAVAADSAGAVAEGEVEAAAPDTTITGKVYLDVGIASTYFKPAGERTLGDKTIIAKDTEPAGRIVIGLYGNAAPGTVANFKAAVEAGALNGTTFSRIYPGEYIQAGRQGSRRVGEVELPPDALKSNPDLFTSTAFKLPHNRPGTVSLSLSENDEEPGTKERTGYRPLEFLITTGPGPVPRLNEQNIVFGRVVEGMNTVIDVSAVPSFQPDIRSRQLNQFASFIGDERAEKVRRRYGRPLKAVIITGSGVLTG